MTNIKDFFNTLPENFVRSFTGKKIWFHIFAVLLTLLIVYSDFDWKYFLATRASWMQALAWPAVAIGGALPIVLPLTLIAIGIVHKHSKTEFYGWFLGQAALLGATIASIYKAFTGRIPPTGAGLVDISHGFNFGILRHGIFWGWPSSHTSTAFAMAVCLIIILPKNRLRNFLLILYALYIGLGVSITIHWFSEFVAGALIGTAIGITVGKSFYSRQTYR